MQASRRITPNTKCVTPARWGNRGAEHGMENRFHWLALATGPDGKSNTLEGKTMNEAQVERVREIVQVLSEKSGTGFDAAFEAAISAMKYHAIEVVPWGESATAGSGGVKKR